MIKKEKTERKRMSGILVHPTSFPSPHGIGDLGKGAYDFIDYLEETGQHLWQVLPLGPTGFGDSPYQSLSAFAGQIYIISPELLIKDGLLENHDLEGEGEWDPKKVDYGTAIQYKVRILKKAYERFLEKRISGAFAAEAAEEAKRTAAEAQQAAGNADCVQDAVSSDACPSAAVKKTGKIIPLDVQFEDFCSRQAYWLNDYALFCAVKDDFQGRCWLDWDDDIRDGEASARAAYSVKLAREIGFFKFTQFLFQKQWDSLREYAAQKEIIIIGDIPIFMAIDCCDVWSRKELFKLDSKGYPTEVAGVPPDYFSATGQLWGNPLYDWAEHEKSGYEWWISRVKRQLELVDYVRIDHFRGFESYWSVPADSENAINGEWLEGPGAKLFKAMQKEIGEDLPIIAEDLGIITEEVEALRDEFHFPGMKVLQFGYGDMTDVKYIPQFYDTTNCVCYTGTHDNETTLGWYLHQSEEVKDRIRRTGNCDGSGVSLDFIRFALGSIAKYAIFPIQDLLQLDNEARMNTPGVAAANWAFRYEQWQLDEAWRKDWLKIYTKVFGR